MKKVIAILTVFAGFCTAHAQTLDRRAVATSGGQLSNSNLSISYTVGEAVVGDFSSTNTKISQGFNQAYKDDNSSVTNLIDNASFNVFPNPAENVLFISSETTSSFVIYNVLGKVVGTELKINPNETKELDVSGYATGVYYIRMTGDNNSSTTVKWVKK